MPYPNKTQWVVIWLTAWAAIHFWIGLRLSDLWPGDEQGRWGLLGYLHHALRYYPINGSAKLAAVMLLIGCLLVWMAAGRQKAKS
jgi:hypothetical protein